MWYQAVLVTFAGMLLLPYQAQAVLPPELVVSAGAQMVGIFSLVAALVVSVVTSIGVVYLAWYQRFKKWSVYIAFGFLVLALFVSNVVYLVLLYQTKSVPTQNQYPEQEYLPPPAGSDAESACSTCAFYKDSITLFIPDAKNPTVVELDLNRRQEPDTTFSHYYFLNGVIDGETLDNYIQFKAANSDLNQSAFLPQISRTEPVDGSVRAKYSGELETGVVGRIEFTTDKLLADFTTRNTPDYTQFQSPTKAELTIAGEKKTAFALVESLHSNDYQKHIFFDGYNSLKSQTHQFVLWDEVGNFYMIDDSEVFSDTPAYPPHSWLLYKNAAQGTVKKGFVTSIFELSKDSWRIAVPDFNNGTIEVRSINEYKTNANGRSRYVVVGRVTDDEGIRDISGVLRIVK